MPPKRVNAELSDFFSPAAMRLAWERYIRTGQREAKDYMGIRSFGDDLDKNLRRLSQSVISGRWRPVRPRKFYQPKPSYMQRTITILPIEDALIYQAFANKVATREYKKLAENNDFVFGGVLHWEVEAGEAILKNPKASLFFFMPYPPLYKAFTESVNHAVKTEKVRFKFDTDITGFFDAIPHYNLLADLHEEAGVGTQVLDLISDALTAWSGTRSGPTPGVGIPQATSASHFLANHFLHGLDNLIKEHGLSYYRYMDDIRIYAHEKERIQDVLVDIDQYLKGHALSLNAKKTSIEELTPETRQQSMIGFFLDSSLNDQDEKDEHEIDFSMMAEQVGSEEESASDGTDQPQAKSDVMSVATSQLTETCKGTVELFHRLKTDEAELMAASTQRKFMEYGFKIRQSIRVLEALEAPTALPAGDLLAVWIEMADRYFWRCDRICWVLTLYGPNDAIKAALFDIAEKHRRFEWVVHHIYRCLAISHTFSDREIRDIYTALRKEDYSWFAKKAVYLLLLRHCRSGQLFRSICSSAAKEEDEFLKLEILGMAELWRKDGISRDQLLGAFGMA